MNRPLTPSRPGPLDAGLFDPASPERSWTLPADWYFDPGIYSKEHAAIFHRSWWYQGHVADLPNSGDYLTGSVVDQEIFIIRGADGELRAFYNVCSHRAHPLLEGQGNTRLIVCPYHQWCYQADGCFRGARGRDTLKDWIPENADLKPIRLEVYAGFLFVNLDPDARPMTELAGKLLKDIYAAIPRQNDLVRAVRRERVVAANWKTVIDNNHECYHCAVNHKSLMELVDYDNKAVWTDDGITFTHTVEKKSLDNSAYKLDAATLEQDALFGFIFPNLVPLWFPGPAGAVMFQIIPTGPETSLVRHDFYFPSREITPERQEFIDWITNTLFPEDQVLFERVQKGLHSKGYRQGKFVIDRRHPEFSEHHVHFFQRHVYEALVGAAR
ncbi:MAG: aromatic ring-hydroxylating dioxygenase subunit alpha [Hyphomicrobiaceae bacterium]